MTVQVRFAPEAQADLDDAAVWYEQRTPGVGLRLVAAVDAVTARIADWPHLGMPVTNVRTSRTVRRYPIDLFPYYLVGVVSDDEVYVVAVAHTRRRPYWRHRVEER